MVFDDYVIALIAIALVFVSVVTIVRLVKSDGDVDHFEDYLNRHNRGRD